MTKTKLDNLQESMVKILNEKGDTVGSGFMIREDGYLVTCHHVIYTLPSLKVNYQGKEYEAQWCKEYSNLQVDIGILKIEIENAKPVRIVNFQDSLNSVTVYGFPREKEKNFPEGFDVNADKIAVSAPLNALSTYPSLNINYNNPWNKLPDKSSDFLTHRINAKVDRGTSGGAVFSEELGGVLGVIQSSKTNESYVIRWDNILDILDKLGLEPTKNAVCRFLEKIQDEFQYLKFFHTRQKISLLKQYIPIEVTLERRYNHEIETWQAYTGDERILKKIYALKGFTEQPEENKRIQVDWKEAKDKHNKMMILADPGMGKSTLLRMEALKIAREELAKLGIDNPQPLLKNRENIKVKDVILPLYFRLSELVNKLAETNDEVVNIIPQLIDKSFQIESIIKEKLEQGKCVLFLDALDEVSSAQLHKLNTKLEHFLDNSPCKIYLTSRIVGYSGNFSGEVKEVEIVPFTDEKIADYIKTWFVNAEAYIENDLISAEGLIEELKNKPQIQGLAQNPLLLSLICSLYQTQDLILPAKRNEVYKQAVDYMLRDWVTNRKLVSDGKRIAKIRLLEIVAYELSCREEEIFIFQKEDFFDVLEKYLHHEEVSTIFQQSNSAELMIELCEEDGIIQKFHEKGDQYLFLHRTFQEHFTACYLHRRIRKNQEDGIALVKAHFWDHDWYETIILLAGMMSDASLLLEAILQEKDDIFATLLILASQCLAESQNSQDSLINQIVDKLYKVWQRDFSLEYIKKTMVILGKTFPVMRRRLENALKDSPWYVRDAKFYAAGLLGEIGNPESIPALSAALDDSEKRIKESAEYALRNVDKEDHHIRFFESGVDREKSFRCWAVKALGEIGNHEALPTIIRALNYSDWFRDNAGRIFGKIKRKQALILPSLISMLYDNEEDVRWYGVKALGEIGIGNSQTIQVLITSLNDLKTRNNAVEALVKINNSAVVSALIETIKNSDGNFRLYAAVTLGKISNPQVVSALIQEVVNHSDVYISYSALEALGNIGNPEAVSALIAILNNSTGYIRDYGVDIVARNKAVEALSKIGTSQAVSGLIEALALNNPYQEVAGKAAEVLLDIGTEEAYLGLMTALNHPDETVRQYAVEALDKISFSFSETMAILIEALNNPYQEVRSHAMIIFAQVPLSLIVNPEWRKASLALMLNDSDETGRGCVATALSLLLNPDEVSALMTASINSDETIRNKAIESLGETLDKIGNLETMSGLSTALEDLDNPLRYYLAILLTVYLNRKGNPEALPILIKALNHSDEYVRRMAVGTLGDSDNPEVVPALIMVLNDSDHEVRGSAALALGDIGNSEAIPALIEGLNDVNKNVRITSAYVLSKMGNSEGIPSLIESLNDSEESIRLSVIGMVILLSTIDNSIVIPILIEALKNSDKNVRTCAAHTLGNIGNSEAIPALIEALNDEDRKVQYNAELALSQIGNSETISALIDVMKYSESNAKYSAQSALIDIGNSEVVSALIELLNDSDKYLKGDVARALGEIGNPEALPALTEALTDADDYVLKYAAEALENMGNLRTLKQIIYRWDIDIYESNVFLLARKLAIRYRKTKNSVIPVYRQRFRFLVKRVRGIIGRNLDLLVAVYPLLLIFILLPAIIILLAIT